MWGAVDQWLELRTDDRKVLGSNPTGTASNLSFAPHCMSFRSDITSHNGWSLSICMPEEITEPHSGVNV